MSRINELAMTREAGPYWVKLAKTEAWEILQWDEDNGCWWTFATERPLFPQTYPNLIIGPRIEPPQ